MTEAIVALDLGGTWLKGCAAEWSEDPSFPENDLRRIRTPLESSRDAEDITTAVATFCRDLAGGSKNP